MPAGNDDLGEQVWVYVEAGAALAQGLVAMRDAGETTKKVILATANVASRRVVGVAQHTIALASFGFILKSGMGEVQADDTGNDQADEPLVPSAGTSAGRADVMVAGEEHAVFAHSTENAGTTAGDLMTCWINCLG